MAFKKLKEEFEDQVKRNTVFEESGRDGDGNPLYSEACERNYRYWKLRLLFEIAGNLDSLVVSYRELVKLNKERVKK